jgi:nucleotide-binding universal stress UspA family protein
MVAYDTVLLPTDGSNGTQTTIDHALSIARPHDATIHVLYVVDRRRYRAADKETQGDVIQSLEVEGERALDDAEVSAADEGVEVTTEMRDGIPHKAIVDYAEEIDADMITMGTHGRTGRDRVVTLGSVTERVAKSADQPVLVVRID